MYIFLLRRSNDEELKKLRDEKNKLLSENNKLKTENIKLNGEKGKFLTYNSSLRRKILVKRQTILSLRKQVNNFKTKIHRRETSLKKLRENSLENSGLDVG